MRNGLKGDAYFIDTLYGPYMTAQVLLSAEPQFADQKLSDDLLLNQLGGALQAFQKSNPQAGHDMPGAITEASGGSMEFMMAA